VGISRKGTESYSKLKSSQSYHPKHHSFLLRKVLVGGDLGVLIEHKYVGITAIQSPTLMFIKQTDNSYPCFQDLASGFSPMYFPWS